MTKTNTFKKFLSEHLIQVVSCERVDSNLHMTDMEGASHWKVTIEGMFHNGTRRTMSVFFSQGSAHTQPPTVEDVMNCLLSDASSLHHSEGFEDWAAEYGMDTDSRKAEAVYNASRAQTEQFKAFLGEAFLTALNVELDPERDA